MDIVNILDAIAKVILSTGVAFGILWYCLWTTSDYRLRRQFSEATSHLSPEQLTDGRARNVAILTAYYQSVAIAKLNEPSFSKARRRVLLRRSKVALIMVTVLDEHIAAARKIAPGPRYLRSRRRIINELSI